MTNPDWTTTDAAALYNVPQWSAGYASVGADGHLRVHPRRQAGAAIDLCTLAQKLRAQGIPLPILVRLTDILRDRVDALTTAFTETARQLDYNGHYTAVYPIKTNQQATVVKAIAAASAGGSTSRVGLEAGSKPELAAVLGLAPSDAPIICNGYKDREYLRRALIGTLLGHRVHVVVEKLSELPLLLEQAAALEVKPHIGLRVRLAARFVSTQQNTGGEKSKFGLSAPQVLEAVARLQQAGQLDALDLLHIHLGSQVASLADLRHGVQEAARYYVELRRLGVPLQTLDVGGGLGVDYEGSHSRSLCSMNYGLRDYARTVLRTLQEICAEASEPVPDVISESGRALTAHHAVLITEVIDEDRMTDTPPPPDADGTRPAVLRELAELARNTSAQPLESLHDAAALLSEARGQYLQGRLSLGDCAAAENIYYRLARDIRSQLDLSIRAHREAAETLADTLAAKYFCNFSVFQSVPDAWAIDQVFPIVPLQRLDERPGLRAKLCDLTCDSDGKLERYVDREGIMPTLAVHERHPGEPYLIGIFMVGAYQEILGDMHNLFGDTHAVNVVLDGNAPEGWRVDELEHGDVAGELLRYVHLSPEDLSARYRDKLATAGLPAARVTELLTELDAGLNGYTYLG